MFYLSCFFMFNTKVMCVTVDVRLAKGELKGESRDGKGDGPEGDGVFPGNNTSDFFGVELDFL